MAKRTKKNNGRNRQKAERCPMCGQRTWVRSTYTKKMQCSNFNCGHKES
jgi:transcription elongation factor Elf1